MTILDLIVRAPRLLFFAAIAAAASPAWATVNCEILPIAGTTLTAAPGDTVDIDVNVSGSGCPTSVTTTNQIVVNGTGSTLAPPTDNSGSGLRTINVAIGPSPGTLIIRVTCTVGCFGSPSNQVIDYRIDVETPVSLNLSAVGPTNFVASPGSSATIRVRADDSGVPAGTTIVWSSSGPVSLSSTTTNTDVNGNASVTATFGPGLGAADVTAFRVDNNDAPVTFDIDVQVLPTRALTIVSGSGQRVPTGSAAPSPLIVEATDDGVASSGVGIDWSVISGDATLVSPTSPTDLAGRAQTGLQLGPTAGTVVVRARRVDDGSITADFTVTSVLSRTLVAVSGNGQSAGVRQAAPSPLVIEARENNQVSAGVGITWAVVSGDASLVSPTATTDASGRAQSGVLFGPTPGPVVVRATRVDDTGVSALFSLTSTLTRSLVRLSGDNQNVATRSLLGNPLVIEARDNGAGAGNVGIRWAVVSGDATLSSPSATTDANGRAQTGLLAGATPGAIVVRATRVDDAAAAVDFNVTATFSRTLAIVSGANQRGLAGLPLPDPIVIEVRANGQPEPGVAVDINIAGGDATISGDSAASAKATRVTGPDGRISAVITLGETAGTVAIQASVPATPGLTTTVAATSSELGAIAGIPDELRDAGGVIQDACAAIARIPVAQRTPEQNDLLARCQSFAGANPEQIADALEELLPDTTLAMVNVALQAGQAQLDNLKARIAALRSGTRGSSFGGLALASPAGAIPVTGLVGKGLGANETPEAGAEFDRWGYFVSGTIGRGESEQGRLTPNYDFDINGLTAGLDYRFSDGFVAGASLGYTRQDTELAGGEGNVDADGYSLSAYATFYRDESWYSDAVLTWGRNDYETQRRIRYTLTGPGGTSTIDQIARGQLDGDLLSIASTVGRDYQAGSWSIGPYGRVLYSRIDFDAGRELISGGAGSGLALEIFPGTHTSLASVVGAKFSTALSRDWGILMPHLQVEWEHEYRDDPQRVGARFLADPNATRFAIEGDPIDSSFFRIGGGLSVLFSGGRSGFLYVERVVGKSGFTQTNVALGIRGEF